MFPTSGSGAMPLEALGPVVPTPVLDKPGYRAQLGSQDGVIGDPSLRRRFGAVD